ncbi:DUF4097 family beta strand repeat-containing protein [Colwellia sp. 12G3]|uniref:DUF4097 family beta strand repeat-containing protein n=1 Tax=Colwellia sp. 12G3 TaxID=2058299 RepID=UPI000C33165F|nr:hypothetical protein [Colwellia sp. 12G3]PKI17047.1 hypothetical protein CXF71_07380 [Colwellia sp. 12G3]
MSKVIKNSLLSLVMFTSFNLLSLQVSAQINEEIAQSFSVTSQSDFSLNNINGTVTIKSWSQRNIKVLANVSANTQESRDDVTINMTQDGQKVTVSTNYKENGYRQNIQSAKVDYQVWLPADSNLLDIELINGSLIIRDISGEVEAEVVNGSVKASGLSGDSRISSVNGSVDVVYTQEATSFNNIELETVNGSIKLYLPENINADITVDTMHGSIKTAYGLETKKNFFSGHNLRGKIGNGGSKINLESVNGSIKVLTSE